MHRYATNHPTAHSPRQQELTSLPCDLGWRSRNPDCHSTVALPSRCPLLPTAPLARHPPPPVKKLHPLAQWFPTLGSERRLSLSDSQRQRSGACAFRRKGPLGPCSLLMQRGPWVTYYTITGWAGASLILWSSSLRGMLKGLRPGLPTQHAACFLYNRGKGAGLTGMQGKEQ